MEIVFIAVIYLFLFDIFMLLHFVLFFFLLLFSQSPLHFVLKQHNNHLDLLLTLNYQSVWVSQLHSLVHSGFLLGIFNILGLLHVVSLLKFMQQSHRGVVVCIDFMNQKFYPFR